MILEPGSFNVNEYRRAIPDRVKVAVVLQQGGKSTDDQPFTVQDAMSGNIQYDHRPPLLDRPYDTEAHDYIPKQFDIAFIFAKRKAQHLENTTGRKEGAEKTVTTRGSDVGERARTKAIRAREAEHRALRMIGNIAETHEAKPEPRRKHKIPQRRNSWPQGRKLQSRNNLRRRQR